MSLAASGSTFTIDDVDAVAGASGLPADEWLRAEVTVQEGQTRWRVDRGSPEDVLEGTIPVEGLTAIHEVCLSVATDSTGAAHFDNLTVVIPEEG